MFAPLAAKQLNRRFVGGKLVRGQQVNRLNFFQRTLAVDVEQTQAVDLIVKKVDAVGLLTAHRIEIEQRATRGVFTVRHHLIDMPITCLLQLVAQQIPRLLLAFLHHQRVAVQKTVRTDALHQRVHRRNQQAARHARQAIERGQARRDDLLMRRKAVIGQRFPVSEAVHRLTGKLPDLIMQAQGGLHIGRNQQYRALMAFNNVGAFNGRSGAGQLTKLTLVSGPGGKGIASLFRHSRFDDLFVILQAV